MFKLEIVETNSIGVNAITLRQGMNNNNLLGFCMDELNNKQIYRILTNIWSNPNKFRNKLSALAT